jgi:hypothetical protein
MEVCGLGTKIGEAYGCPSERDFQAEITFQQDSSFPYLDRLSVRKAMNSNLWSEFIRPL